MFKDEQKLMTIRKRKLFEVFLSCNSICTAQIKYRLIMKTYMYTYST